MRLSTSRKGLGLVDVEEMDLRPSLRSGVDFLEERFRDRRCDHEAVSCCERCNVWYLVQSVKEALDSGREEG